MQKKKKELNEIYNLLKEFYKFLRSREKDNNENLDIEEENEIDSDDDEEFYIPKVKLVPEIEEEDDDQREGRTNLNYLKPT